VTLLGHVHVGQTGPCDGVVYAFYVEYTVTLNHVSVMSVADSLIVIRLELEKRKTSSGVTTANRHARAIN
jgi:hypothetical protein